MVYRTHEKGMGFDKHDFDTESRNKELYTYLFERLYKTLQATVAGSRRRSEVFRRITREEDPVIESTVPLHERHVLGLHSQRSPPARRRCGSSSGVANTPARIERSTRASR